MKATIIENKSKLLFLLVSSLILDIFIGRLYYCSHKTIHFLLLSIPQYFLLIYLYKIAKPTIKVKDSVETIVFVRELNNDVTAVLSVDIFYILIIFKALFIKSYYGFLILLGIPLSITYELFYKPFYSTSDNFKINKIK